MWCDSNDVIICMQFMSVEVVTVKGTIPEAGCYWLQVCYVAVAMVMLDYMCVQSVMITHTQCYVLLVKR